MGQGGGEAEGRHGKEILQQGVGADAVVRNVDAQQGTKVESPAPASLPADEDGVEATGGVRGGHSHSANPGQQAKAGLDQGVDAEHLRSASQGVRPDDITDATDPSLREDERPGR